MMTAQNLDYVLCAVGIILIITGWRRGLITSAFAIAGVILGLFISRSVLVNAFASNTSSMQLGLLLTVAVALISIGSALGSFTGRKVKKIVTWGPLALLDGLGGAALSLLTGAATTWIIATLLLAAPTTSLTQMVNESRIIAQIDSRMPARANEFLQQVHGLVTQSDLPTGLVGALLISPIDAPDATLVQASAVHAALDSVVRVEGVATQCKERLSGSGFVIDNGFVITNAHVVAGTDRVGVRIKGKGTYHSGNVVYFDPLKDIAVIKVPQLDTPVLNVGDVQKRGEDSVVAGFPGGGSLTLVPARVRTVTQSHGTDIYGEKDVHREIYALRTDVRAGDSGAPLITPTGQVAGMVFAVSATDPTTGYALTATEIKQFTAVSETKAVNTGKCAGDVISTK